MERSAFTGRVSGTDRLFSLYVGMAFACPAARAGDNDSCSARAPAHNGDRVGKGLNGGYHGSERAPGWHSTDPGQGGQRGLGGLGGWEWGAWWRLSSCLLTSYGKWTRA